MTGAQMRYYNLTAGYKVDHYLKIRLALDIVRNYENGNSENYSRSCVRCLFKIYSKSRTLDFE